MEDHHTFAEENERFEVAITFGAGWYRDRIHQTFIVEERDEQVLALAEDIDKAKAGPNRIRCIDKRHARRVDPCKPAPGPYFCTMREGLKNILSDIPFPEAFTAPDRESDSDFEARVANIQENIALPFPALPTDQEVEMWWAGCIDETATVGSAVYKFRMWLKERAEAAGVRPPNSEVMELTGAEAIHAFAGYIHGKPYFWRDGLTTLDELLAMVENFIAHQKMTPPGVGWSDKLNLKPYTYPGGPFGVYPKVPKTRWRRFLCAIGIHSYNPAGYCQHCGEARNVWAEDPND